MYDYAIIYTGLGSKTLAESRGFSLERKIKTMTKTQMIDLLLNGFIKNGLINSNYRSWFAVRFYKLPTEVIVALSKEAEADGRNKQMLFCDLIKKEVQERG